MTRWWRGSDEVATADRVLQPRGARRGTAQAASRRAEARALADRDARGPSRRRLHGLRDRAVGSDGGGRRERPGSARGGRSRAPGPHQREMDAPRSDDVGSRAHLRGRFGRARARHRPAAGRDAPRDRRRSRRGPRSAPTAGSWTRSSAKVPWSPSRSPIGRRSEPPHASGPSAC